MKCLNCKKEFKAKRSDAKFCSGNCRVAFNRANKQPEVNTIKNEPLSGFIYIVECGKYYKIGITLDIKNRMGSIQTDNPHKLRLIFCQKTIEYQNLEAYCHNRFKDKRIRGEWFELTIEDVKEITAYLVAYLINNPKL